VGLATRSLRSATHSSDPERRTSSKLAGTGSPMCADDNGGSWGSGRCDRATSKGMIMGFDDRQQYVTANRRLVDDVLTTVGGYGLFKEVLVREDPVECIGAAQRLRGTMGNHVKLVSGRGPLRSTLLSLEGALQNFVRAGGPSARAFAADNADFNHNLGLLRRVFAKEARGLVDEYDVSPTTEILDLMRNYP
jgi:hypothetical protein